MTSRPTCEPKQAVHLLTLVRHPETTANVAHLLQGSTDSPLSVHGQNQLNALVKAIQGGCRSKEGLDEQQETAQAFPSPLFAGVAPTGIWSSPLPRAWKLACGIQKAFEKDEVSADSDGLIALTSRKGLEERSFGDRECSRKGRHVTGFPLSSTPFETPEQWSSRVQKEGRALLTATTADAGTNSHIVTVTHGLWIASFFEHFLGKTVRLPFADNTGVFTLSIEGSRLPFTLHVVCANDTSHLAGIKRQRGGIGSSASDKRQRTLADIWSKKDTDHGVKNENSSMKGGRV